MDEAGLRSLLSSNIKRFRNRKGLSQAKLAEKMNISTNYLSDIETGRGWVSPFSLIKLANALEIEVFELFKGDIVPSDGKQLVTNLSKDITSRINSALEDIFTQYLG